MLRSQSSSKTSQKVSLIRREKGVKSSIEKRATSSSGSSLKAASTTKSSRNSARSVRNGVPVDSRSQEVNSMSPVLETTRSETKRTTERVLDLLPHPSPPYLPNPSDAYGTPSQYDILLHENTSLQTALYEKSRELDTTLNRLSTLFSTMESQQDFMKQLDRSIQLLKEQMSSKDMEIRSLREQNGVLLKERVEHRKTVDQLNDEKENVKRRSEEVESDLLNTRKELKKVREEHLIGREGISSLQDKIKQKDHTISQLSLRLSDMEYEVRQCVEKMKAFGYLKSENALLSRKISQYETSSSGSSERPDYDTLLSRTHRLEKDLSEARSKLSATESVLLSQKEEYESKTKLLQERILMYEKEVQGLKERHIQAVKAVTRATEAAVSANALVESSWIHNDQETRNIDEVIFRRSTASKLSRQNVPLSIGDEEIIKNQLESRHHSSIIDGEPTVMFMEEEAIRSNKILDDFSNRIQQLELEFQ